VSEIVTERSGTVRLARNRASSLHGFQPPVVRSQSLCLTLGGGRINNPGRSLVLFPPINGATAASGTPYFSGDPGDPYRAWDAIYDRQPSPVSRYVLNVKSDR
jgi:hypothetical protein